MLCDHIGAVFMDDNAIMRAIGRMAFPIFAFLLAEGYRHTSDKRKYFIRLMVFAFVSEAPFDLVFYGRAFSLERQNVFFTLAAGIVVMYAADIAYEKKLQAIIFVATAIAAALFLRFDYGLCGLLIITAFYMYEPDTGASGFLNKLWNNMGFTVLTGVIWVLFYGVKQLYALFAIIPITLYNGERGRSSLKYVFYLFYPVHLLVMYLIIKTV